MRTVINQYAKQTAAGRAECLSGWYHLLGMIDAKTRAFLWQLLPEEENGTKTTVLTVLYERKAKSYIAEHFREPIRVSDIAASMNSQIFRRRHEPLPSARFRHYAVS